MNYWINIDGVQKGPLSIEELKTIDLTDENVYVWCEGMPDWERACDCAELKDLIATAADAAEEAPAAPEIPAEEAPAAPEIPAEEAPVAPEIPTEEAQAAPEIPAEEAQAAPEIPAHQPQIIYVQQSAEPKPCPPTNLVWAILTTVLCCTVCGVVSIVYASQVQNAYAQGDYDRAFKCSERAAAWSIAGIVLGIITQPLAFLPMLLQ